jgi:hypothetical protein
MNWSELALTVDDIVSEFGQRITVTRNMYGEYDVDTGLVTNTQSTYVLNGVLFDYGEKDINGTTILKGDKKLLVQPTGISTIENSDIITVNGKDYTVVNVTETNPAGINLLFEVALRGIA